MARFFTTLDKNFHNSDGEADFVILHLVLGILSVEVKYGGVAYREGNWIQINRFSGTEKVIDPFHVQSFAGTAGK